MSSQKQRLIALAKAKRALRVKIEREKQSNPNGGLMEFIRYFWKVLEPERPFVEGWVLEGLCEHLEAITRGELTGDYTLNRLLANVSPGSMKSLCLNVFWPAFEWGPMGLPHLRYVAFSYAAHLTERDNAKFRDLIRSREYQELWGHVFKLTEDGKIKVANDKTGFKFASSVGGVGTGERADRVLCLPGDQKILTDHGWLPISEIVEYELDVQVAGLNHSTNQIEWQRIEAHERNPGNEIIEIACEAGTLKCTRDHPVYVSGRGYARADSVRPGDQLVWTDGQDRDLGLPALQQSDQAQTERAPEILQQAVPYRWRACVLSTDEQHPVRSVRDVGVQSSVASVARQDGRRVLLPRVFQQSKHGRCKPSVHGFSVPEVRALQQGLLQREPAESVLLAGVLRNPSQGRDATQVESGSRVSAMRRAIHCGHQDTEVLHSQVRGQGSLAPRGWNRQRSVYARRGATEVSAWVDAHVQGADQGAGWRSLPDVRARSGNASLLGCASHRLQQGKHEPIQLDHALPVLPREATRQAARAPQVDATTVTSVRECGREDVVYNIRVAPHHNYFANNLLTHNCDDPHAANRAESETIRESTVRWFRETMSNRLNNLRESAIIVVMQRVHEEDVSGAILEDGGYEHYCIPMEYDSGRHCTTSIGWTDPRSVDGELAWPERFSREDLQTFKRNPYLWSGQYQQMPVPRGGGLFKFDWFQSYPVPASKTYDFVALYTVASLDTAFKEKEENDYSALTVWSVYEAPKTGQRRIMLMDAWQKRLQLHGTRVERNPDEDEKSYLRRAAKSWGLCEWVAFTCSKRRVNTLLIEDSSRGTDVNNEIKRLFADRGWGVQLIPARGDKWSRAHSVVDLFTDEMIYAPGEWQGDNWIWRDFADIVINQACAFPRAAHDDLVDSMVQALRYLRDNGLAIRRDEKLAEDFRRATYKPQSVPLYDV